jgi:Ca-activated chloride channel homolog
VLAFAHPEWLWLLIPLAGVAAYLLVTVRPGGHWQQVCDPHLVPVVVEHQSRRRVPVAFAVLLLAWLVATLALAGPSWDREPQSMRDGGPPRIVVLDVSISMTATDVAPSRLEAAKFKARDILARSRDRQAAVIIYAGEAYAISPLTTDSRTLDEVVEGLYSGIVPVPGSNGGPAIRLAHTLLERAQQSHGEIILLTDASGLSEADRLSAKHAHNAGYAVHVLVTGTARGGALDMTKLEAKYQGQAPVWTAPDVDAAGAIATAGGGSMALLTGTSSDLDTLLKESRDSTTADDAVGTQPVDGGPFIVLALLPLAALGLRRGWLSCIAGIMALTLIAGVDNAEAFEWPTFLLSDDQRGMRAYLEGDHAGAAMLFENASWRASANFHAGNYEAAANDFSTDPSEQGLYNWATALAFAGTYQKALLVYETVLHRKPAHADALHNHAIISAMLLAQLRGAEKRISIDEIADALIQVDEEPDAVTADAAAPEANDEDANSTANRPLSASGEDGRLQSDSTEVGSSTSSKAATIAGVKVADAGDAAATKPSAKHPDQAANDAFEHLELRQSIDQMLQRVPDDVVGLLENKLRLRFGNAAKNAPRRGEPW